MTQEKGPILIVQTERAGCYRRQRQKPSAPLLEPYRAPRQGARCPPDLNGPGAEQACGVSTGHRTRLGAIRILTFLRYGWSLDRGSTQRTSPVGQPEGNACTAVGQVARFANEGARVNPAANCSSCARVKRPTS